jgi:HSP20 family protein
MLALATLADIPQAKGLIDLTDKAKPDLDKGLVLDEEGNVIVRPGYADASRTISGASTAGSEGAKAALDVIQDEQRYVVRADLPGLSRDEVEITFQDGVLTIKGEKKQDERPENHRLHLQERFHGSFTRNLRLPERVDTDKIEATMKDGVLELVLPFVPEVQPRKIVVNG